MEKQRIGFEKNQIDFMIKHSINPNDFDDVFEKTDHLMRTQGWDKNYVFNDLGEMCEGIIDTLVEMGY